ncbi:MAG: UbiD family decarboxylase [Chloroflexi bacterium]|nr:UbiD family decarboxylase [Chloroflexota bacterium]
MTPDLRAHLQQLEERDLVAHIKREVDPRFEIDAVLSKLLPMGKAAIFERVKGSDFPVVGNVCITREMLSLSLDCARDEVPRVWRDRTSKLIAPEEVSCGPVQEVVRQGAEARLDHLPVCFHSEKDAGPFITASVAIARDPDTGVQNVSFNRMQFRDERESGIRSMPPQNLGVMFRKAEDQGRPLEVAIALGLHPIELCAAATSPAHGIDELSIAGALRGESVPVVRCKTIDVLVPANAEMVLEGEILPGRREPEAPFGDFMQAYMPEVQSPIFRLRAITHRHGAMYHDMQAGCNDDMLVLAPSREAQVYDALDRAGMRVKSVSLLPTILGIAVSIEKQFEREAKNAALTALGSYRWGKTCIVVDHDVDVYSYEDVLWAFTTRCRPDQGVFVIPDAMGFPRDPFQIHQSKLGIDATVPLGQWTEFERKQVPGAAALNLEEYL